MLVGFLFLNQPPRATVASDTPQLTVYKSATCGCCAQYIAYLKREGFEVETVNTEDMAGIKQQYGIPASAKLSYDRRRRTCHGGSHSGRSVAHVYGEPGQRERYCSSRDAKRIAGHAGSKTRGIHHSPVWRRRREYIYDVLV